MILGKIVGKTSTKDFKFQVTGEANIFDYVQVMHHSGTFVLGQIEEIEKDAKETVAFCTVIGYRDKDGKMQQLKYPLDPGVEVLHADDDFIQEVLGLENKKDSAYIGVLDGHENIKVYLDLNKVLSKHVTVLAKSGSGKSYSVSVLLEELLLKKIPVVVIDPHGEYASLKFPNPKEKERMIQFGIEPKAFLKQIIEFSPDLHACPDAKPLRLGNKNLTSQELTHLLPTKLSSAQLGMLYSALKNLGGRVDFDELLLELETAEDNPSKWTLINIFQYVKKLNLFSDSPTLMGELVKPGKMSIINLKGVAADVQEIIAYKIINDLFTERKRNTVPPFFLVVEECHNFIPERSFGEAKSSAIIRQVAAEGRKFGLGLCLISQRPSRVDKSAISQASTQIILKVTNPNDVKAVSNSVEGITVHTEKQIQNIPVGTALVTGIVDLPLLVNIRPRMTKHGGEAVSSFVGDVEDEEEGDPHQTGEVLVDDEPDAERLPIIKQQFTLEDVKLMYGKNARITEQLVPCVLMTCSKKGEEFNILIDLIDLQVIENMDTVSGPSLLKLNLQPINPAQEKVLDVAVRMGEFKAADLFAKSGLQFSELYDTMNVLARKGYFVRDANEFRLSSEMEFLATLDQKRFYQPLTYAKTKMSIAPAKYQYTVVKDFLSKFFDVRDVKECYVEKYSVLK